MTKDQDSFEDLLNNKYWEGFSKGYWGAFCTFVLITIVGVAYIYH
jgi:hypothetical protein